MPIESGYSQLPGNYYYQPLTQNGPAEQSGAEWGGWVGGAVGSFISKPFGFAASVVVPVSAAAIGKGVGETLGFLIDNYETISENFDTFTAATSDPTSWEGDLSE